MGWHSACVREHFLVQAWASRAMLQSRKAFEKVCESNIRVLLCNDTNNLACEGLA